MDDYRLETNHNKPNRMHNRDSLRPQHDRRRRQAVRLRVTPRLKRTHEIKSNSAHDLPKLPVLLCHPVASGVGVL